MQEELLQRAFEINPNTVFGILVGLQLLLNLYLLRSNSTKERKLIEINQSTINVLKDLNTTLLLFKEQTESNSEMLRQLAQSSAEKLSAQIQNLSDHVRTR